MAAFTVIIVTMVAIAFGLDAWPAALVIGPIAGIGLGHVHLLRRVRAHRRNLVLTMLPATDLSRDRLA